MDAKIKHSFETECFRDGQLIWKDNFDNLVVTAGLNAYIDSTLVSGALSPKYYAGLKYSGNVAAADTMAAHAGWTELVPYSNATRPQWSGGPIAAGSCNNSGAKAIFNINVSSNIFGAFLANDNTKGGTAGTLLGGGDFASPRTVDNGDTLNVTVTNTISAA